jgi:hypothetical protein
VASQDEYALGIRIDRTQGIAFFGIEEVNRQLRAGRRIKEIRPGGAVVTKVGEDGADVSVALSGCDLQVVFEAD